jgi:hypothetical protein
MTYRKPQRAPEIEVSFWLRFSDIARYPTCFHFALTGGRTSIAKGRTKSSASTTQRSAELQRP